MCKSNLIFRQLAFFFFTVSYCNVLIDLAVWLGKYGPWQHKSSVVRLGLLAGVYESVWHQESQYHIAYKLELPSRSGRIQWPESVRESSR